MIYSIHMSFIFVCCGYHATMKENIQKQKCAFEPTDQFYHQVLQPLFENHVISLSSYNLC